MDKAEAILIGRSRYSETSLIIHWCSAELGLFRTIAKGAQRPKSTFAGLLDLFVSMEIEFRRSRTSDLHTLTEVKWTHPRLGLRSSYGRVLAATYLVKLVTQLVEPHAPIPGIHELMTRALDYLAEHDPSRAFVERFELRLAEDLGLVGAAGASGAQVAHSLEHAIHRHLPVQRRQVLEWISAHSSTG
jgi:DNA repair protein RecO (recombination protein O)